MLAKVSAKSDVASAINYSLKRWAALMCQRGSSVAFL
jgi:hypothetical protein